MATVKKIVCSLIFLTLSAPALMAHQPVIVEKEAVRIEKPEISRAFYDELKGSPRTYFVESEKTFDLYVNLLVPKNTNPKGRYSARIYEIQEGKRLPLAEVDGDSVKWEEFYEPFGGDTYLKGPEFKQNVPAGKYEIEVYSRNNLGKYVLAVGEKESFGPREIASVYTTVPRLKAYFFETSPLSFLWTPFGIIAALVLCVIIYLFISTLVRKKWIMRGLGTFWRSVFGEHQNISVSEREKQRSRYQRNRERNRGKKTL